MKITVSTSRKKCVALSEQSSVDSNGESNMMGQSLLPEGKNYAIVKGDCIPNMFRDMPAASVDMLITSVPFPAVYSYSSSVADIGNSENLKGEGKIHLSWFFRGVKRVLKPGRVAIVHCWQIPRMKRSGGVGLFDFRGLLIRLGERAGLVYEYDWLIDKNPQAQALRSRSRELQFAGLESDRAKSRGALGDYLIKFRAPGENKIPVVGHNQVSRNDWIDWAEVHWDDIRQTDTLNVKEGRGVDDVRHICALQLGLIERCIRMYSNPGELIHDPFMGIASTAYCALKLGRRAYGTELKDDYWKCGLKNCERALKGRLFSEGVIGTGRKPLRV